MRILLLIMALCCSSLISAQGGIVLSKENAADKGISPIWPKCEKSTRQSPNVCFDNKLRLHIVKTFQYPEIAKKEELEGTVTVEFVINQKGKVEVTEVNGGHRFLQREAIRIIRKIPKMEPAKWGSKPISVAYVVPITFRKPQ